MRLVRKTPPSRKCPSHPSFSRGQNVPPAALPGRADTAANEGLPMVAAIAQGLRQRSTLCVGCKVSSP